MLFEAKKAVEAMTRPGIDTSPTKLIRNAIPYYMSPTIDSPPPLTLYFSVNSVCNLRCKMCDVGVANEDGTFYKNLRLDGKRHEIPLERFCEIIDEVADDKPFIALNSTEPLIWKPVAKAIEYCTIKGLKTSITTGAYSLPLLAEELADAGLDRLNVSIDGPKDIHNFIRGRKDSFEKSLEGIKKFQARVKQNGSKAEVHLNAVISNMNYEHLSQMVDELEQFNAQRISLFHLWFITDDMALTHNQYFGRQYPVSASCINEFTNPDAVDVDKLWQQLSEVQRKSSNVIMNPHFSHSQLVKFYHNTSQPMDNGSKCMASWFFIQILADGSVIPYTRCHNVSMGDIYEQSFKSIWNGEKMKKWRSFIHKHKRMPMCNRCDLNY